MDLPLGIDGSDGPGAAGAEHLTQAATAGEGLERVRAEAVGPDEDRRRGRASRHAIHQLRGEAFRDRLRVAAGTDQHLRTPAGPHQAGGSALVFQLAVFVEHGGAAHHQGGHAAEDGSDRVRHGSGPFGQAAADEHQGAARAPDPAQRERQLARHPLRAVGYGAEAVGRGRHHAAPRYFATAPTASAPKESLVIALIPVMIADWMTSAAEELLLRSYGASDLGRRRKVNEDAPL